MNKQKLFFITIFLIVLIASLPLVSAYTLSYDANGNLITGDGKFRIYNGFNKLVQVRDGDNATAPILENYTWHPMEDRIFAKSVYQNGSWQETVFYITKDFIRIKNATGTFDYKYIYQNGQLVAQQNPDGSKLFFHNDNKGSTSLVTNESGDVVEETFYEPFGKIISGGTASRFQYEAKEYSSVVGDYDFHARKYIPGIGWTQPDTIIQNVYDPQSLNRYAFERNNPYRYTDPTGHDNTDGRFEGDVEIFMELVNYVNDIRGGKTQNFIIEVANSPNNAESTDLAKGVINLANRAGGYTQSAGYTEEATNQLQRGIYVIGASLVRTKLGIEKWGESMAETTADVMALLGIDIKKPMTEFTVTYTTTTLADRGNARTPTATTSSTTPTPKYMGGSSSGKRDNCGGQGCVERVGNTLTRVTVTPITPAKPKVKSK